MGATEEDIQVSASMFDLKRRRRKRQKKGEKGHDHACRRGEKGEQLDLLRRFHLWTADDRKERFPFKGRRTKKVLTPQLLSAQIRPRCFFTIFSAMDNPNP